MKKKKTVKRHPVYPSVRASANGTENSEQNNRASIPARSNGAAQQSGRGVQGVKRRAPSTHGSARPPRGAPVKINVKKGRASARSKRNGFAWADIIPFIILAISLLAETCLILDEQSGAVGKIVHELFFGLFGPIAYTVPICALFVAFYYKELISRGTLRFKTVALCVLVLTACCSYSLIAQNGFKDTAFSFSQFWNSGLYGESGGVFGGIFGFLFGKLLGSAFASVLFVLISVLLLTFSLGFTRIGVWKAFFKYESAPSENKALGKSTAKAGDDSEDTDTEPDIADIPVPNVSATGHRIDTTIIANGQPSEQAQRLSLGPVQGQDYAFDFSPDGAEQINPSSSGFDVLNFNISEGNHTVETVDFTENGNLREKYKPADLMEDFGFNSDKNGSDSRRDIYDEAPVKKTPYVSPYRKAPVKKEEHNKGYSPFANPLISYEEFKKENESATGHYDNGRKNDEPTSYSPFSDPLTSMNAPTRSSERIAPQLYIANDATDRWEALNKGSEAEERKMEEAPDIPIPAPDEVIEQVSDEDEAQVSQYGEAQSESEEEPEFAPLSRAYGVGIASNGAFEVEDFEQADTNDQTDYMPESVTEPTEMKQRTPAFASPVAAPTQEIRSVDELGIPEAAAAPSYNALEDDDGEEAETEDEKPDIKSVSALRGNTQIEDEVEIPETEENSTDDYDGEDDEPEEEERGINFYSYKYKRYPNYVPPSTELLDPPSPQNVMSEEEIYEVQSKLLEKLASFKIEASLTGYSIGPSITRYEIMPGPGVKVKQITALSEDIGLALQSEVRIVTVPGKAVIGVEVPNRKVSKVSLRSLIENPDFRNAKSKITVCIGLTVSGKPIYMNIDDMPHVLVAGQTKSGKSVAINCMLISLIYRASPDEVQFILIDPKRVELSIYSDLPHMVMPVIDDPKRAAAALKWAVAEMERRYQLLSDMQVRNRDEYYALKDENPNFEYMPQIVIIIDELADLMLQVREHVEELINRLAAMARACGIHLVIGTQRPSVDIVTGLIKANIPSRVAFKVANPTDSRIILGNVGAEKLLGRGDMLYHPTGANQIRAQGAFVDTPEIKRILKFIVDKNGKANFNPEIMYALQTETDKLNKNGKKSDDESDDMAIDCADVDFEYLCKAIELVINLGKATTNLIQRHLKIGFNRASNIAEKLEDLGFISKSNGSSKGRDVLVDMKTYLEWKNANQK